MRLENEFLLAEISESGAEVTRIFDKQNQTEVLWEGNPTYWKRHSPVLFPNVGKTYLNIMRVEGVEYPTSQHGFARDSIFTCESLEAKRACFRLRSDEDTKKRYPFEFELKVIYQLSGRRLTTQWEVKNLSEKEMYFTIGGHPAFRFVNGKEKKEDYCLKFPGKSELNYCLVDPETGTADLSEIYKLELQDECCPLSEEMFAKDALIFDGGQIETVWICHKDGSPYVGMECAGFPNFGIWSVKDAPFVCLEPWMGRCDNYGFEGDISEKPGVNKLGIQEVFVKEYEILVG